MLFCTPFFFFLFGGGGEGGGREPVGAQTLNHAFSKTADEG